MLQVAAGRILNLLNADAKVTVITPRAGLHPEVAHRIALHQVTFHDRSFIPLDLDPAYHLSLVLVAIDDPVASSRIWKYAKYMGTPANIADVPPECDFYFGSVHRDGPLQIMVSTNGNGPRLAAMVRKEIARTLPGNIGEAIVSVGALRRRLRRVAPTAEEGPKRMKWMSRVCDQWSLEELVEMDDGDMKRLLGFFKPDQVPTFEEIRLGYKREDGVVWEFDGSFGWAI